jgi:hypothetical protein
MFIGKTLSHELQKNNVKGTAKNAAPTSSQKHKHKEFA